MKFMKAIKQQEAFTKWATDKTGNVYKLFEQWLYQQCGDKHRIRVSFDWMASEEEHEFCDRGWINLMKLPKWFRQWVSKNGRGPYGTEKRIT